MQYLLTSLQMKELDARTIREFGLPARVLMENAGKGCADLLRAEYPELLADEVCVLCGSGNNGGDGAVIARWLHQYGISTSILRVGAQQPGPETQANLDLCAALGIPMELITPASDLTYVEETLQNCGLVIDAIFGIGFRVQDDPWLEELFAVINSRAAVIAAIDIPSGLDADTGYCSEAVYADLTFCIESLKLGHAIGFGKEACGDIRLIPIGIPDPFYQGLEAVKLFTEEDFDPPMRHPGTHKNDYGKAFVFGGCRGFTGAAALSARAALRAGAGYAYVLPRPELADLYALKLTEALTLAIPQTKTGSPEARTLGKLLGDASALLIGPGLGRDDYALKLLQIVLKTVEVPLVIDADGLNLLSEHRELYPLLARPNVLLTPHWGEFARLSGVPKDSLERNCLALLRDFVAKHQAKVLLKSHFSVFCDPECTWVVTAGNDGLATGGSGDVLAGIIVSFLAQGMELAAAAINASYLLGSTAERLAEKRDTASIIPGDIVENLFVREE